MAKSGLISRISEPRDRQQNEAADEERRSPKAPVVRKFQVERSDVHDEKNDYCAVEVQPWAVLIEFPACASKAKYPRRTH